MMQLASQLVTESLPFLGFSSPHVTKPTTNQIMRVCQFANRGGFVVKTRHRELRTACSVLSHHMRKSSLPKLKMASRRSSPGGNSNFRAHIVNIIARQAHPAAPYRVGHALMPGKTWREIDSDTAAAAGHLHVIQRMIRRDFFIPTTTADKAAENGHFDVVVELYKNGSSAAARPRRPTTAWSCSRRFRR